jgi:hypothetical protein
MRIALMALATGVVTTLAALWLMWPSRRTERSVKLFVAIGVLAPVFVLVASALGDVEKMGWYALLWAAGLPTLAASLGIGLLIRRWNDWD